MDSDTFALWIFMHNFCNESTVLSILLGETSQNFGIWVCRDHNFSDYGCFVFQWEDGYAIDDGDSLNFDRVSEQSTR